MKETLTERPPIVAVMGHVDHGKSTLLDFIRHSNTVAKEFGGITQHVAAYEVLHEHEGVEKRITFIDTPGHAAFQTIRARGANVADIAILVVAADDGVKAQTLEALESIRSSGIPFIVAINKIDKPNADVMRTQTTLLEHQVYLEQFGGDVPWVAISAKNGTGVPELLDLVLLLSEMQELKADPSKPAQGYVVEAHRDQKRGIAATLIITDGTLKSGMMVVAGHAVSPVRIMEDHQGKSLKSATFSSPVSLVGFDELPEVGATFQSFTGKREAEAARSAAVATIHAAAAPVAEGTFALPVIVRADTTGSLEAIEHEVAKIGDEHARISIVQSGIGSISEDDVKNAIASKTPAILIGFNVGIEQHAETLARERGIAFSTFNIIYKMTEHLEEALKRGAPKRTVETVVGRAKIIKVFSSHKREHLVGAGVLDGIIDKDSDIRILRRKENTGEGVIIGLQSNRQNVSRVAEGEFGSQIESEVAIAQGDVIECVTKRTE